MPSDIAEVETPFESLVDEECFPDSASSVNDREFGPVGLDAGFSLPKVAEIFRKCKMFGPIQALRHELDN